MGTSPLAAHNQMPLDTNSGGEQWHIAEKEWTDETDSGRQ